VRVQERLISTYVPQRLQRVCEVSQRRSQPIVTRGYLLKAGQLGVGQVR
jgi:hypothetical protein